MQTTTNTQRSFLFDGPTVVETFRGSAHPKVPTTRPTIGRSIEWAARRAA